MERHTLRSDDLIHVVDESLKDELHAEKKRGVCLKEQLKFIEVELKRINDSMN